MCVDLLYNFVSLIGGRGKEGGGEGIPGDGKTGASEGEVHVMDGIHISYFQDAKAQHF